LIFVVCRNYFSGPYSRPPLLYPLRSVITAPPHFTPLLFYFIRFVSPFNIDVVSQFPFFVFPLSFDLLCRSLLPSFSFFPLPFSFPLLWATSHPRSVLPCWVEYNWEVTFCRVLLCSARFLVRLCFHLRFTHLRNVFFRVLGTGLLLFSSLYKASSSLFARVPLLSRLIPWSAIVGSYPPFAPPTLRVSGLFPPPFHVSVPSRSYSGFFCP